MSTIRSLPNLVRAQFKAAQASGDLTFYTTSVAVLKCNGLPFQLRFSPALANKPKSNKDPNKKPIDPFENLPKGLFVLDIAPEHYVVLNKFPVIPGHFILATKEFKQQTDLLEENDLRAAWDCLKAYKEAGEELFGFFNSGDHSGASQPHRHIQFLPVESMRSGIDDKAKWSILADTLLDEPRPLLPFLYFLAPLPENPLPGLLHQVYKNLHEQAKIHVKNQAPNSIIEVIREEESDISYNLGITDRVMVLCPRLSEGVKIEHDGKMLGPIALNGTVLGGTLLVKNEEEWDTLRSDESKLIVILRAIGIAQNGNGNGGHL